MASSLTTEKDTSPLLKNKNVTGKMQNVAMFGLNKELGKFEKQKQC